MRYDLRRYNGSEVETVRNVDRKTALRILERDLQTGTLTTMTERETVRQSGRVVLSKEQDGAEIRRRIAELLGKEG